MSSLTLTSISGTTTKASTKVTATAAKDHVEPIIECVSATPLNVQYIWQAGATDKGTGQTFRFTPLQHDQDVLRTLAKRIIADAGDRSTTEPSHAYELAFQEYFRTTMETVSQCSGAAKARERTVTAMIRPLRKQGRVERTATNSESGSLSGVTRSTSWHD